MTAATALSEEDKEYLTQCEDLFKDRYTEKDESYMKVHNADLPTPPVIENWWVPQNSGRRNDNRSNRRNHPYNRNDRRSGYDNDYDNDRGHGYRHRRY